MASPVQNISTTPSHSFISIASLLLLSTPPVQILPSLQQYVDAIDASTQPSSPFRPQSFLWELRSICVITFGSAASQYQVLNVHPLGRELLEALLVCIWALETFDNISHGLLKQPEIQDCSRSRDHPRINVMVRRFPTRERIRRTSYYNVVCGLPTGVYY